MLSPDRKEHRQPSLCLPLSGPCSIDARGNSSHVTVCSFFTSCPPIFRTCCSPKARRNMVLCEYGVEICLVLVRWEDPCICFSASPLCRVRHIWVWAIMQWWVSLTLGAPLWAESKETFQTSSRIPAGKYRYIPCLRLSTHSSEEMGKSCA